MKSPLSRRSFIGKSASSAAIAATAASLHQRLGAAEAEGGGEQEKENGQDLIHTSAHTFALFEADWDFFKTFPADFVLLPLLPFTPFALLLLPLTPFTLLLLPVLCELALSLVL